MFSPAPDHGLLLILGVVRTWVIGFTRPWNATCWSPSHIASVFTTIVFVTITRV